MEMSESYVLSRIQRRDREAFRYMYEHYFSGMVLFAESYLYDEEEARDCVQELFFRLWDNALNLNVTTSLKAYLFVALRNKCLNVLRDRKIRDSRNDRFFEPSSFDEEEDYNVDENMKARLQQALDELPDRCREIFLLKIVQGKKNREIAEELNLAETTVKTQIQRAYRYLREKMVLSILFLTF